MATLIRIDGTTVNVNPVNEKYFSLEEMQTSVGGYVEMFRLDENTYMLVNEEGLISNLPKNKEASSTLTRAWSTPVNVFGHVLIVDKKEMGDYYV